MEPERSEAAIGIMLVELPPEIRAKWDELVGSLTNSGTFNFRVKKEVVHGASEERVIRQGDLTLTPNFIEAARKLEQQGVRAIVGECGFMALFQKEISRAVSIPVVTSSLIQVPLVYRVLGKNQRVGILTWNSKTLLEKHFNAVGWSSKDIPISVVGVQDIESWQLGKSDWKQRSADLAKLTRELVKKSPDVGAIVLECTGMPPYARYVQEASGLPIFDIVTLTRMVFQGGVRT